MSLHSALYNETTPSARGQLRPWQAASLVALGIVLWFLAAMLIRYGIPAGLFGSKASIAVLYAATIPGAWLLVRLCRRTGALTPEQIVPGVAIASAAALPCDGMALTWAPQLYGPDAASILPAAAWLLWGVGFCLTLAVVNAGRETS